MVLTRRKLGRVSRFLLVASTPDTEYAMYSHCVIIGGTGMLLAVSVQLAADCRTLTSVARTSRSLHVLDAAIQHYACTHYMLTADWSHADDFIASVASHVRAHGPTDLVLAWLHDDALGPRLATALAPAATRCTFYQVRGSTAGNPAANTSDLLRGWRCPPTVNYHQIILGFHADSTGSRWLRDDEICDGVLGGIAHPQAVTVVGTTTPWTERPG